MNPFSNEVVRQGNANYIILNMIRYVGTEEHRLYGIHRRYYTLRQDIFPITTITEEEFFYENEI